MAEWRCKLRREGTGYRCDVYVSWDDVTEELVATSKKYANPDKLVRDAKRFVAEVIEAVKHRLNHIN